MAVNFSVLLPSVNVEKLTLALKILYGDAITSVIVPEVDNKSFVTGVLFGDWEISLVDKIQSLKDELEISYYVTIS